VDYIELIPVRKDDLANTVSSNKRYTDQAFDGLQMDNNSTSSSEFFDCYFRECSFVRSVFRQCRFINCKFLRCDLSLVQLPGSSFSGTIFQDSKCVGINWALASWTETGQLGNPIRFKKCALNHSTFIGLSLEGIQFTDCVAVDVDFREADLTQVDFSGTDLSDSLFNNTNLSGADLSQARNYLIDPANNELKGARFSLPEAMSLLYNLDIELLD
jgi:fluoroquinolone resistance protein